jgi:hypothetical protein
MARAIVAACFAAVLLLASGCGVGSTDEGDISAVTGSYLQDLADGDFAAACGRLVESARTAVCAGELERAAAQQPDGEIEAKADGKSTIAVDGDTASVALEGGGTLELERGTSGWRIASGYPR